MEGLQVTPGPFHDFWLGTTSGKPYVAGMSEDIRHICKKLNSRVVFKSRQTLHSMLTKEQSNVAYRIPCSCIQVYIGETRQRLETSLQD